MSPESVSQHPKITANHIERRAVVYVRQSTVTQLLHNRESQRRQYGLADHARSLGFRVVDTIDEDLGRSGSGLVERPGFSRLVAMVCSGEVGAVLCIEASRLARNGRDWHHLIELCGLAGTLVIDPEGIYDPRSMNDRLLLGLKGTMSEFELNLLRQRSVQAILQKAQRGALQYCLPIGLCWTRNGKIELDPDRRVQAAIGSVFAKFIELGSARQVLLWFRQERITLPRHRGAGVDQQVVWELPIYGGIIKLLQNPLYAGAYAYGKTEGRIKMRNGRASKTAGHRKPKERWIALIQDHHPRYLSWEQYLRNQVTLAENAHMKRKMSRSAARGGHSLLAGLLRCGRCGRMLHVGYSGTGGTVPRYFCRGAHINHGEERCLSVGGLRIDSAVSDEILKVVEPLAIESAIHAAELQGQQNQQRREALRLELEQARYEARLAERRYEAMDPENRLVAAELEARWNASLQRVAELEGTYASNDQQPSRSAVDRERLLGLASELPRIWYSAATDKRLKQRIAHILLREAIVDVDDSKAEIALTLHWIGGRHSQLRVAKNKTGQHRYATSKDAIEVIRAMAGRFSDQVIASTLNRLSLKTGHGLTWIESRVRGLRHTHGLPKYDAEGRDHNLLTLQETADRLGISPTAVKNLIEDGLLAGTQVVSCAPWLLPAEQLDDPKVRAAVSTIQSGKRRPRTQDDKQETLDFTSLL
jgi:DNA invertase Pin-like site-specific DNA recombinase